MEITQLQQQMRANQVDGWLLYDFRGINPIAMHVAGIVNSGSRRWFLWIPAEGEPRWLIHAIEGNAFRNVSPSMNGEKAIYVSWRELEQKLAAMVQPREGKRLTIAMEYSPGNAIPYVSRVDAGTKEMVERVTGAAIVSSADLVQLAQAVLTPAQIESHRRAAEVCLAAKDAAFDHVRKALAASSPLTELDVQRIIVEFLDARQMEFDHPPIVAVNANAANPHYAPSADNHAPIRPGDMLLIDLWARERGDADACYADITWTAYCGATPPPRATEIFRIVAAGRDAAVKYVSNHLVAGDDVRGYAVDDACREVIADAGYGERFIHRTGHSLGTTGHFNGVNIDNLETEDRRSLIPGLMFTVEPGIYLPTYDFDESGLNKGLGIRSEINCVVHVGRLEVTTLPLQDEIVALGPV